MVNKKTEIILFKNPHLAKCDMCHRVKDIFYKILIFDAEAINKVLVGDLNICKQCGGNMSIVLGEKQTDEKIIKEFNF